MKPQTPPHLDPPPLKRRSLAIVLALAFVTRLAVLLATLHYHPHNYLYTHGIEMGLLADSLVHHLGYSSPFGVPTGPTAIIAPGYPTLVAAVFLLFGSYSYASAIVIMSVQLAIALATVWLIMHVSRQALDARTAIVAGAFWAVSPPLLWMPTLFWETSISACALPAMFALALHYRNRPTKTSWIVLGAYCAVIGLINPALLPSLLAIVAWLAWETRSVSKTAPLLSVVAFALLFSAWPIRNAVRFHAFIPLRSTVGFELWMGNRPGGTGYLDTTLFPMFDRQELDSYIAKGEVAYSNDKSRAAWDYIRAHPATFIEMTGRRVYRYWTGTGNAERSPIWEVHSVITAALGFAGLAILCFRRRWSFAVLFAVPILLFPLPYYITHAEFKYRLNIDPVMTILAAYAVTQLDAVVSRRAAARKAASSAAPVPALKAL